MAVSLQEIRKPIAAELEAFELQFRDAMKSKVPLLDAVMRYIVKSKGKQVRPMFVFLAAKICGPVAPVTYRGAALIELLHTATLVHDDVVDDSFERRGFFSINALWKNKIAVLVGDYLLSKGLLLSLDNDDFNMLKIVSRAVKEMSEGELLQIEKARKLDIREEIYFEVIRQKTASLISSACACGAASAGADEALTARMRLFGEKVGIAFQIKDDLLDFSSDDIGKPRGIDIQEKKMTLPIIYVLQNGSASEKREIINTIKNHNTDSKRVASLIALVRERGGITYATQKMQEFQAEALLILHEFPENESRTAMEQLVRFTTERKK